MSTIRHKNPSELVKYLENNQPELIDVREDWEYQYCHIDNVRLIPMGEIVNTLVNLDKNKEYVLICHHGIRSLQVARYMVREGFKRIVNLTGGIDAWAKEVDNTMPTY